MSIMRASKFMHTQHERERDPTRQIQHHMNQKNLILWDIFFLISENERTFKQ